MFEPSWDSIMYCGATYIDVAETWSPWSPPSPISGGCHSGLRNFAEHCSPVRVAVNLPILPVQTFCGVTYEGVDWFRPRTLVPQSLKAVATAASQQKGVCGEGLKSIALKFGITCGQP